MKIRVMASLVFNSAEDAQKVLAALPKPLIRQFALDESFVSVHRCYHDESPTRPCELIREWRPPR